MIKNVLPNVDNLLDCPHDDTYLWKIGLHAPSNRFSTADTWNSLHPITTSVTWHKAVWFKNHIPKHAFISWVVAWNRLHTRDRLRNWGLSIPSVCVLCNQLDESRNHLFFECEFSSEIWRSFTSRAGLNSPAHFNDCLLWLISPSRDKNVSLIIRLIYQASVYFIWRERNLRIHSGNSRSAAVLTKEIKLIIRARLDPLSRKQISLRPGTSLLCSWFRWFQHD
ncbi:Reverse transcriptase zinc-binding domain [Arabidopsis suecica]|uniref:Reverse transcriptase zinc-binding domain n=1 Tax=Arabidopsis suecica TaxID=45249 RepID=A0A8T2CMJ7_ARASU|nr:Reverse transcriptase zinc-binding domain [Arabidopsis suecica]